MKTKELSLGEKQAVLKLRKEGKSTRAIVQALGIACTTTWNVMKKKETTGVLSNRHKTGEGQQKQFMQETEIVRGVKEKPQNIITDITKNIHRAGVKVSQSTIGRRLRKQQYRDYTTRCKPLISSKNLEVRFAKQVQRWATKVMELTRPIFTKGQKCVVRRDVLMTQNIQAYLRSMVEEVSWLGLAWLLLELAH